MWTKIVCISKPSMYVVAFGLARLYLAKIAASILSVIEGQIICRLTMKTQFTADIHSC
jgi:hypothetical protein